MTLLDEMLGQRLMIDAGRLQSKDHPAETLPLHVKTHLAQQMPEALGAVLNHQPLEHRLPISISKERMMLALADVQADYQILGRTPNALLELTEFIDSVTLNFVHGNLLLALRVMVGDALILTGGYYFIYAIIFFKSAILPKIYFYF